MDCGCQKKSPKLAPVIEIKNEPCPVLFLTTETDGKLTTNPPVIGKYHNTLVVYQESNARVMYDSYGVPVILSTDGGEGGVSDFDELDHRPKYNGILMTHLTDIPEVPSIVSDTDFNALWEEV